MIFIRKQSLSLKVGCWNLNIALNLAGRSAAVLLTHHPLDKTAAISQTIFSDAFSWMKSFVFCLKFHQCLFLGAQWTIAQHWFIRRQAIIWTNADPIHWRVYAALGGGDELSCLSDFIAVWPVIWQPLLELSSWHPLILVKSLHLIWKSALED